MAARAAAPSAARPAPGGFPQEESDAVHAVVEPMRELERVAGHRAVVHCHGAERGADQQRDREDQPESTAPAEACPSRSPNSRRTATGAASNEPS